MAKSMVCQVSSNLRRAVCGRVGIIGVRSSVDSVCGWVGFGCVQVMTTLTTFMCVGFGVPSSVDNVCGLHPSASGLGEAEARGHTRLGQGGIQPLHWVWQDCPCRLRHKAGPSFAGFLQNGLLANTQTKTHAHSAHPTLGMNAMIKATGGHH